MATQNLETTSLTVHCKKKKKDLSVTVKNGKMDIV